MNKCSSSIPRPSPLNYAYQLFNVKHSIVTVNAYLCFTLNCWLPMCFTLNCWLPMCFTLNCWLPMCFTLICWLPMSIAKMMNAETVGEVHSCNGLLLVISCMEMLAAAVIVLESSLQEIHNMLQWHNHPLLSQIRLYICLSEMSLVEMKLLYVLDWRFFKKLFNT